MGTRQKPRYEIVRRLDAGGMAEVFLGKSSGLEGFDKPVAIKRVLPHLVENTRFANMFLDEARLSLHLSHANIVAVNDVGKSGTSYFIVMEYIEGTNLKRLMSSRRLPLSIACFIIEEVCKGLAYAHRRKGPDGQPLNIVHRDVSPPNIMLSKQGEVKITDFGLARAAGQIETTDPGVVKGKFAYLSPEAALGGEIDHRADIYAAGICFWEMLAGRRLFDAPNDLAVLDLVRAGRIPPLREYADVPEALEAVLLRALEKDVSRRWPSAREFGQAISRFRMSAGIAASSYDLHSLLSDDTADVPIVSAAEYSDQFAERLIESEIGRFFSIDHSGEHGGAGHTPTAGGASSFEDPRDWGLFDEGDFDGLGLDSKPEGVDFVATGPGLTAQLEAIPDRDPRPKAQGEESATPAGFEAGDGTPSPLEPSPQQPSVPGAAADLTEVPPQVPAASDAANEVEGASRKGVFAAVAVVLVAAAAALIYILTQ